MFSWVHFKNYFLNVGLLLIGLNSGSVDAHLMPVQEGSIKIQQNVVLVTFSIPVTSLINFDDNQDKLLEREELEAHRSEIFSQIKNRLTFESEGRSNQLIFFDVLLSPQKSSKSNDADQLIVYEKLKFAGDNAVKHLIMNCNLFGSRDNEKSFLIFATQENEDSEIDSESLVFDSLNTQRELFIPLFDVFIDFIKLGVEHILTGFDHLLFLLTVLVAGYGVRYWVSVVTVFSVAHSITLAAIVLAIIYASPAFVEPCIAASIVLMALGNIFFLKQLKHSLILLIIFLCGLLHGLGFGSALDITGFNLTKKIITLIGFNLGIELGQLLFLISAITVIAFAKYIFTKLLDTSIKLWVSIFASICGSVILIQRILF